MIISKKHLIALAIIIVLIISAYWNLPQKQFIGDEWDMIAETMYLQSSKTFLVDIFKSYTHHFWPLYYLSSTLQYRLFGLNPSFYAIAGVMQHCLSSALVYYLCFIATRDFRIGLVAGLIFALNSNANEMITSIAVYPNHGANSVFVLLCLIFFLKKLQAGDKALSKKFYAASLAALFISLLFGEWSIFLVIVLPVWSFIYEGIDKRAIARQLPIFIVVSLFLILRMAFTLTQEPRVKASQVIGASGYAEEMVIKPKISKYTADSDIPRIAYKIINYPAKIFAQEYLPRGFLTDLSGKLLTVFSNESLNSLKGNINLDNFAGNHVSIGLSVLFVLIAIYCFVSAIRDKNKLTAKNILLFLSFAVISVLPYAIPAEVHTFLESRYFYQSAIGSSILLSIIVFYLGSSLSRKIKTFSKRNVFVAIFVVLLICPLLVLHFSAITSRIDESLKIGVLRKNILQSIVNSYPKVREKSIFYVESNKKYFGLDEYILPFDYGFGHILLTEYHHDQGLFDREFFNVGKFFRRLNSEGYLEINKTGFGFFRHLGKVFDAVEKNNLSADNIYAFSFNGDNNTISDITQSVRKKVNSYKKNIIIYISKTKLSLNCKWFKPEEVDNGSARLDFTPLEVNKIEYVARGKKLSGVYFEEKFGDDIQKLPLPYANVVKDDEAVRVDTLYSAKIFRHYGWVGPLLIHYVLGNGTNVYRLPSELYGKEVVNINSVVDLHSGEVLYPKEIRKTKDGSWIITLKKAYSPKYSLEFRVYLSALQIDFDSSGDKIAKIAKTVILTATGNGKDNELTLSGKQGRVGAFATFKDESLKLNGVVYINGEMEETASFKEGERGILKITFDEAPPRGALIEVPAFVEWIPENNNDNIAVEYSGYSIKADK